MNKSLISVFIVAALCLGIGEAKDTSLICGESSSAKTISLVSPSSPPNICEYTILAKSKSVCQMRVDFSMSMAQPVFPSAKNDLKVPECTQEFVEIGGIVLCGSETEQHLYIPINRTAGMDSLEIAFNIAQRKGSSKLPPLSWDFKVTQLECPAGVSLRKAEPEARRVSAKDAALLAPTGCNQFYPDDTGTIESFNYNGGEGMYPFGMNYVMCFRRTTSTVGMRIYAEDFNLGQESNGLTIFTQTDSNCYPQLPSEGRIDDYLMIPQAEVEENYVRATYFCGRSINELTVLSSNPGPIFMVFNSGSVFKNNTKTLGFSLKYEMVYE